MLLKPTFSLSPHFIKSLITTNKTPSFFLNSSSFRYRSLKPLNPTTQFTLQPHKPPHHHLSTTATAAADDGATLIRTHRAPITNQHHHNQQPQLQMSKNAEKRARRESPSGKLLYLLGRCSKDNDIEEALRLYDDALINNIPLNVEHYNKLLYLCSSSDTELGLKRGFEIYKQMDNNKIVPNEATFTTMARLAALKEDPQMAFNLVKRMKEECGISPKLRSYVPALSGFCTKGLSNKAYEVDSYMIGNGVEPEEPELAMLLRVSFESNRTDKVYEMLQRLRTTVRQVSEETATLVENWFRSDCAGGVGAVDWDVVAVKEAVVKGGGGWHGQGWLGNGKWEVMRTEMDEFGVCGSCGEKLVSVDIDPLETENFAKSLTNLACQRETRADFLQFQEWVQKHGPFDAVVDGANVGHIKGSYFDFNTLKNAVNSTRRLSPSKKLPLVILHNMRVKSANPKIKTTLQYWKESGALYVTPLGSNDDWYWLYAAISSKCLLVTNDEMRDHLFALLGTSFFPRWKEKHQVRLSVSKDGLKFHMPPPYSIVIQESEQGSWHIPTVTGDDFETRRQWVCAHRTKH